MSLNPYESPPLLPDEAMAGIAIDRTTGLKATRTIYWILLLPALLNELAFLHSELRGNYQLGGLEVLILLTVLGVWVAIWIVITSLVYFGGFYLIELLARGLRFLFAPKVSPGAWNHVLYTSLHASIKLVISGAILWAIWVIGFYVLEIDFYVISWLIGVPAHILGACFYVPLLYKWYRLRVVATQT
jgi:hypothetical protein